MRATACSRTDVCLLNAPSVDVNLGQRAAVAIGAERPQCNFSGADKGLQSALRRVSAGLVQFRRVNVRQPHLLVVANERIAVDGDATFAGENTLRTERGHRNEQHTHAAITRE